MTNITEITDQLTLVVLDIRIWSGRKKLRAEDLHLDDGEIPPEDLVSLGSKRVCDPEQLKAFHRLKQSAERSCLRVGTRFLGGFAVAKEQTTALAEELDQIKAQFDAERDNFLSTYDRDLEDWIQTLPGFETAIRRAVEPASSVAARLRFGYQLVEIKPAIVPGTLDEEVAELGDGVFGEVEQMARDLTDSFEGKDKLNRRALGTFRKIRNKLACLSFIDRRIEPVLGSVDQWLHRLPATAPIQGSLFNEGMGLALLLSDAERMARHGAGQIDALSLPLPTLPTDKSAEQIDSSDAGLEDSGADTTPEQEGENSGDSTPSHRPVITDPQPVPSFFF
ncbi:DUF3150 domain-containing protein [Halorhodospira halochloris]|uniref:DUF3150 domain-containing protein n=1 Tax=Halorhodospira halochloris TaxID=1052 RepID=UPI001EE7C0EC|nr:DUF3150 domain-containing protein [Halorhodospira halochloris]MCG5547519.1 DUF3150 domain-containing protein [Halorhodospira halochloris]